MAPTGSIVLHLACRGPTAGAARHDYLETPNYLYTERLINLIKGRRAHGEDS